MRPSLWIASVVVLTAAAGFAACKSNNITSNNTTNNNNFVTEVTQMVGPPGGDIIDPVNHEELVIPAGALATTVTFTLGTLTNAPPLPSGLTQVGPVFVFRPEGQMFSTSTVPATQVYLPVPSGQANLTIYTLESETSTTWSAVTTNTGTMSRNMRNYVTLVPNGLAIYTLAGIAVDAASPADAASPLDAGSPLDAASPLDSGVDSGPACGASGAPGNCAVTVGDSGVGDGTQCCSGACVSGESACCGAGGDPGRCATGDPSLCCSGACKGGICAAAMCAVGESCKVVPTMCSSCGLQCDMTTAGAADGGPPTCCVGSGQPVPEAGVLAGCCGLTSTPGQCLDGGGTCCF